MIYLCHDSMRCIPNKSGRARKARKFTAQKKTTRETSAGIRLRARLASLMKKTKGSLKRLRLPSDQRSALLRWRRLHALQLVLLQVFLLLLDAPTPARAGKVGKLLCESRIGREVRAARLV